MARRFWIGFFRFNIMYFPTGDDEIVALAAHNGFSQLYSGRRSIIIYEGAELPKCRIRSYCLNLIRHCRRRRLYC